MENRSAITMQIPLVLAKVGKQLPTTDLVVLRQTCKLWNQVLVVHSFRARHEPIDVVCLGPSGLGPRRKWSLAKHNRLLRSSLEIPFSAYSLHLPTNCESGWQFTQPLEKFLDLYGDSIRSLSFRIPVECTGDTIPELVRTLRCALSRGKLLGLNRLEIHNFHGALYCLDPKDDKIPFPAELPSLSVLVLNYSIGPVLGEFLGQLVQAATGLKALKLLGRPGNAIEFGLSALRDFQPRLGQLRELKTSALNLREMKILVELGRRTMNRLQLQSFSTSLCRSDDEGDYNQESALMLQQFLVTQAHELQKFKIKFNGFKHTGEAPALLVPQMAQLAEFSFNTRWRSLKLQLSEGNLRDNFPRLRKLVVGQAGTEDFDEDLMAVPLPGVSEVKVHLDDLSNHIDQWRIWLPSVVHCQILIHTQMRIWDLSTVWTTWPAMETLRITYQDKGESDNNDPLNLDEFLSGVPASRHRPLRKELLKSGPLTLVKLRGLLEKYKIMSGISDLSRLKQFVFKAKVDSAEDDEMNISNLTDIGGYFGFAMVAGTCGQLQHVEIQARDSEEGDRQIIVQISDECRQLIRQAMGKTALINW